MNSLPKISIITPVFNAEDIIENCILSVAQQTYLNKEHVIIDGVSSDNTLNIIKKYSERYPHIRWISEKDNGIYDAMNKGIDLSEGNWLHFLGSDDVFYNNEVINSLFHDIEVHKYDVIYGNVQFRNSGRVYDGKFSSYKLLERNICHQAIFYNRKVYKIFGKYDVKYKILADWVFNMKWFNSRRIQYKYFNMLIAIYNEDGYSKKNEDEKFLNEVVSLRKKYFSPLMIIIFNNRRRRLIWRLNEFLLRYQSDSV